MAELRRIVRRSRPQTCDLELTIGHADFELLADLISTDSPSRARLLGVFAPHCASRWLPSPRLSSRRFRIFRQLRERTRHAGQCSARRCDHRAHRRPGATRCGAGPVEIRQGQTAADQRRQSGREPRVAARRDGRRPRLVQLLRRLDHAALDTIGNAEESAKWVQDHDYNSVILVTNNYHMPRSLLEMSRLVENPSCNPTLWSTAG